MSHLSVGDVVTVNSQGPSSRTRYLTSIEIEFRSRDPMKAFDCACLSMKAVVATFVDDCPEFSSIHCSSWIFGPREVAQVRASGLSFIHRSEHMKQFSSSAAFLSSSTRS